MFSSAPTAQLQIGSIGWENEDLVVFPGDPSNDGYTYIRVQLFAGKDPTIAINPKRAQGTQILCSLNSMGGFRLPPKDTRCYVAIPPGMEHTPGAGIIMGTVEKHQAHLDLAPQGDQILSAADGQARAILKSDGSITLYTTFDNTFQGQSVYFRVKKDGFELVSPWGTIKFDVTGFHVNHVSGAQFDLGGIYGLPAPFDSAPLNQLLSYIKLRAGSVQSDVCQATFSAGATNATTVAGTDATQISIQALQSEVVALLSSIRLQSTAITALGATPGVTLGAAVAITAQATAESATEAVIDAEGPVIINNKIGTSIIADPGVPV